MTKYTNKFKELVVRECLENSKTLSQIARNFNIPSQKTLRTWINQWRDHGTFERSVYQYTIQLILKLLCCNILKRTPI